MTTQKNNSAHHLSQADRSKGGQHSHSGSSSSQNRTASTSNASGKDPVRVEAGKKAAETRNQNSAESGRKGR